MSWFTDNPEVDVVFSTAPAVLNLLLSFQDMGLIAEDVVIGTVDLDEITLNAIRAGTCEFAVDQQPYMQGYLSIITLDLESRFLIRPSGEIQTGPFFVDSGNVEAIAELIRAGYR